MGFCDCTAKFALFVFNLICALLGLVIVAVTIALILHGRPFKELVSTHINVVYIVFIVVGVAVFLIAFLGCCGAVKESKCMINAYAVILSTLLVIQCAVGITAFVYKNKVEDTLNTAVEDLFQNSEIANVKHEIESDLKCCGVDGPKWYSYITFKTFPPSCCEPGTKSCNAYTAYQDGCKPKVIEAINKSLIIIGAVALGICVIELICIIFAFCLSSRFEQYNSVRSH